MSSGELLFVKYLLKIQDKASRTKAILSTKIRKKCIIQFVKIKQNCLILFFSKFRKNLDDCLIQKIKYCPTQKFSFYVIFISCKRDLFSLFNLIINRFFTHLLNILNLLILLKNLFEIFSFIANIY